MVKCGISQQLYNELKSRGVPVEALSQGEDLSSQCGALRVNLAGNKIGSLVTPTSITPLERLFRKFPVDGAFTATPSRPCRFELGAINVPPQMAFVLLDHRFAIQVPSGVAAGDTRELEERRLSRQVGWDIKYTDSRMDNLLYELEPTRPSESTETFSGQPNAGIIPGDGVGGVAQSLFDQIRERNATGGSVSALSTLPQRHRRDSQLNMPFTYVVNENKRVNFECVIFRPLPIPVAFFEVEVSGFFIGQNSILEFTKSVVPCVTKGSV